MNEFYQFVHPATGCTKCTSLVRNRQHVVWSRGPKQSPLMAIGEAPGVNEDVQGIPFVGRAGRKMDELLTGAGFDPRILHIANRVMCRPPGNRDPEPQEVANCEPWLLQHLRMVDPKALILFGRYAVSLLFDQDSVAQTQGLMYTRLCFYCGGRGGTHRPNQGWAQDGNWIRPNDAQLADLERDPDAIRLQEGKCGMTDTPLIVAAIYHPASALRNPAQEPAIVHQLTRLREEIEYRYPGILDPAAAGLDPS